MPWKLLSTVEKYHNRYMTVTEDELETDHGDRVTYGVVHKEPAVIIIPWDGTHFVLVGQYRYPVDFFSWEFPAGHYEHASIEATARAELEEEAGLTADKLREIGEYHIAPGHNTQVCHVFLATGLKPGIKNREASEKGMLVKQVTLDELKVMIRQGSVKDGLTIAALKFFELEGAAP